MHPLKVPNPYLMTDGAEICSNKEQSKNALSQIVVTDEGIETCVKWRHFWNDDELIVFIVGGIDILLK